MEVQRLKTLEAIANHDCGFYYEQNTDNFSKIPGSPVAYWASDSLQNVFQNKLLYNYSISPSQNVTGNNGKFVRKHWELEKYKVGMPDSWIFYAKGGGYRKWWGNLDEVVDWSPNAREIYQYGDGKHASQIINHEYWYKKGITWGLITSALPSFRVMPEGATYDKGGSTILVEKEVYNFALALLNSKVYLSIAKVLNPTLNYQVKDIRSMPLALFETKRVSTLAKHNIDISKSDWDSFETSWDFAEHPLVKWSHDLWDGTSIGATMAYYYHGERPEVSCPVELCYLLWQGECNDRFAKLKANEEELNRIFIDIYGLQDELTPEVEDKDVTVRKADLSRDIRSLLSYAVGCIFGRYSLDKPGLAYAGGEWDAGKYSRFQPVTDNVIPLCDEEYFGENDLVNRVVDFIKEVFGAASLEENLAFIAKALGNKGNTSREVIRNYFLKDFFADHCKIYQKRPIYWMFDSGKKNGFKALVYLHRWDDDTTGRVNNNYLSPLLRTYAQQIVQENNVISASSDARTVSLAQKRLDKLKLQQAECEKYEKNIAHLAGLRIALDLDDGVKVNYVKAQTAADGKNLNVLAPLK